MELGPPSGDRTWRDVRVRLLSAPGATLSRSTALALLDAFHIGGSVRNVLLVLAVQVVASVFPFTPGGAGVQQALLVTIFAGSGYVASFSVGQQIATAALSTACGFAALVLIFRFRSFREVIDRGKAHRRGESGAAEPVVERGEDVPARA